MKPGMQWRCYWTQCRHSGETDKAAEDELIGRMSRTIEMKFRIEMSDVSAAA